MNKFSLMIKRASMALFLSLSTQALAANPANFERHITSSLLCHSNVEGVAAHRFLEKHYGKPYKHADGAYWYKVKAKVGSASVTEVFVSDTTSVWRFIGAVSRTPVKQFAAEVSQSTGTVFYPLSKQKDAAYMSRSGSAINQLGRGSKILCLTYGKDF